MTVTTTTFNFTGAVVSFTVPFHTGAVTITATGGDGGLVPGAVGGSWPDGAVMAQLVTLGATLVGSADQLAAALGAVSGSNTAKAPLQIVNAAVQAAADQT